MTGYRQLAIRLASEWIVTAAHNLTDKSRGNKPRAISVRIGDWSGELPPDGNYVRAGNSFGNFVNQRVKQEVGRVKITRAKLYFATMLAAATAFPVVVLFLWLFAHLIPLLPGYVAQSLVEAIALALRSFIRLRRAQRVLPKRREEVRKRGEAQKEAGLADLREAARELQKVFQLWEAELVKETSLVEYIREQPSQNDPMSAPAIKGKGFPPVAVEAPRRAALPGGSASSDGPRSADPDESFAFELPSWDLLPPPSRSHGLAGS